MTLKAKIDKINKILNSNIINELSIENDVMENDLKLICELLDNDGANECIAKAYNIASKYK